MKRLICFCLAVCLLGAALTGCSEETTDAKESVSQPAEQEVMGAPPLSEELKTMYGEAESIVRAFTLCDFKTLDVDFTTIDGNKYVRIDDPKFGKYYTQMMDCLQQYFTTYYINNYLLTDEGSVRIHNGAAYVMTGKGKDNAKYAGHVFHIFRQTEQQINLRATVYYAKDTYTGQYFYETPKNPQQYTTKEFSFVLIKTEDGWRYDSFAYLKG